MERVYSFGFTKEEAIDFIKDKKIVRIEKENFLGFDSNMKDKVMKYKYSNKKDILEFAIKHEILWTVLVEKN